MIAFKKSLFFPLLVFVTLLKAQEPVFKTYDWESSPALHFISNTEAGYSSVILKDNYVTELAYDGDVLVNYTLMHKIIKANNDKGVEQNNRIFLPYSVSTKVLVTKARVITSEGVVKELKEGDIKEGVNNETKTTFKYFALDGLDVGSEIEYLIVFQQEPEHYGRIYQFQNELPKRNVEFSIFSPSNLIFISKSYNNLPELVPSVTSDGRNKLSIKMDTVPAIKPEQFAVYDPNLMQVVYKLNENTTNERTNIINYVNASQTVSDLIQVPISKSTGKELEKLIKKINVTGEKNTELVIRLVEDYIKKNFLVEERVSDEYKTMDAILEFKNTDDAGITKLFAAIFNNLKIDYQLVLTTNRQDVRFDPKFEAYNFLDEYLFFFPSLNKYLCPGAVGYRLGLIPNNFTNNYGLFIKLITIGGITNAMGEINFIEPLSFDQTKHNHFVKLDFTKLVEQPVINYELILEGYYAQPFQPYYSFITPDQQKDVDDFIIKNMLPGVTVSEYTIENKGIENLALKPLIIKAKSNSSSLVDRAGNKYLFKIGELIGPQVEMYQEEERKFDIENDFNRSYYREITFIIPDGYKVNNLEALRLNVELKEDGNPTSYFTSEYELKGNTVIVKVHEDYKSIYYPRERFPEYRNVINAAADFNKIVLVLEKK